MLPFFNKYPYTNFEQLNLDWMMNMIGSFDARITKNTEDIHALDIRVTVAESDIDDLQDRMTTAEGDIDDLQDRMTTAEGDIDDLQDRMTTAEGKIETLETVVGDNTGGLVKDVDDLQNVVGDEHGGLVKDVDDLIDVVGDDDSGLIKDVNDLESSVSGIPIVVANPAGTPTGSLVTLGIDDDIYTISGGGGGSGTEVIANPSGTAAADLEKVSIAGIIYDIPTTDITALTERVSDLETVVGDSSSGLVKDVSDLDDGLNALSDSLDSLSYVVGDNNSGLVHDVNQFDTRIDDLENVVGDDNSGLVKDDNDIKEVLNGNTLYNYGLNWMFCGFHNTDAATPNIVSANYPVKSDITGVTITDTGRYLIIASIKWEKYGSSTPYDLLLKTSIKYGNDQTPLPNVSTKENDIKAVLDENGFYCTRHCETFIFLYDVMEPTSFYGQTEFTVTNGTPTNGGGRTNVDIQALKIGGYGNID